MDTVEFVALGEVPEAGGALGKAVGERTGHGVSLFLQGLGVPDEVVGVVVGADGTGEGGGLGCGVDGPAGCRAGDSGASGEVVVQGGEGVSGGPGGLDVEEFVDASAAAG
ncbi:hypothetical protein ACIPLC_27770 [Kitasatospora sp. NPDC086801]|uniref:hypothetical protein n=1 Tax=Kitasatospora sp. NPDC086801 TaxID=3364066 RepID=UPI00380AEDF6